MWVESTIQPMSSATLYIQSTRASANKDRLTVLKGLQPGRELKFILNPLTFSLIEDFKIPTKWQNTLKLLPQETVLSEAQFNHLLNKYLPKLLNNLPGLKKQQLLFSIISKLIVQLYKLFVVMMLHNSS